MIHQQRQQSTGLTGPVSGMCPPEPSVQGNGHTRLEQHTSAGSAIVRHLWSLVHFPTNTVSGVFTGNLVALRLHKLLDCSRNVTRFVAGAHHCDANEQRLPGHIDQFTGER